MNLDLFISGQEYLFYLAAVMISVGVIKDKNYFADFIQIITTYIKSKRLAVALVSMVGGVLPIPGRVTVSAGILDTMAPSKDDKKHCHSRSKFGIVDYLSTHMYYLFSPLEKTIIVPMAVLGLSYTQMLGYTAPLLVASLGYIGWYIFYKLKEDDIVLNVQNEPIEWTRFVLGALPIFVAIAFLVFGFNPAIVFPATAAYYVIKSQTFNIPKLLGYVNWTLVGALAAVIVLGNLAKSYNGEITDYLQTSGLVMTDVGGFALISVMAFMASFAMGSSGKYAGIVALLASIYGIEYLMWFIAIEYGAYLISPTHKCSHIGRMYFGTEFYQYYGILTKWVGLLLVVGGLGLYLM